MKTTVTGRKMTIRQSLSDHIEKKLAKFDRFFDESAEANVKVSSVHNMVEVEVTIRDGNGMIIRAEETSSEATEAVDRIIDVLLRQIRRNKTRLEKRFRQESFAELFAGSNVEHTTEEDSEYNVVRSKKFAIKPMDVEEAILQMNLLGHKFFMFRDMETNEINVVYLRNDGNYGLLEPNDL